MGYTSCFFVVFNILAASHQETELLRFFKSSFRESSFLLYLCFYVFYMIPRSLWLKELMANETLLTNFMMVISNMSVFLSKKVQMMSIKSLKGKLSLYILENTTPQQPTFHLKRTQTQLADYFGVQRPSLARTIGEMIREGWITLYKRELSVLQRGKLEELV